MQDVSQAAIERKLAAVRLNEHAAIERATEVSALLEEAHAALQIIEPATGRLSDPQRSKKRLLAISKELKRLDTTWAQEASTYLAGPAQQIIEERAEFGHVMHALARGQAVRFVAVEHAAHLWQLYKQHEAASWWGTRKVLEQQMQQRWMELCEELSPLWARALLFGLFEAFRKVLAASSAVEWANGRLGAVLPAQKRVSSGMLYLRAAFLNLNRFVDGWRKGFSPHQLLTGQKVEDWLEKLGYPPRQGSVRSLKSLGWRRLVGAFEPTWRRNWLGMSLDDASEEVAGGLAA